MFKFQFQHQNTEVFRTGIYNQRFAKLMFCIQQSMNWCDAKKIIIETDINNEIVLSIYSTNGIKNKIQVYIEEIYKKLFRYAYFKNIAFNKSTELITFNTEVNNTSITLQAKELALYCDVLTNNENIIQIYGQEYVNEIIKQPLDPFKIEQKIILYEELEKNEKIKDEEIKKIENEFDTKISILNTEKNEKILKIKEKYNKKMKELEVEFNLIK